MHRFTRSPDARSRTSWIACTALFFCITTQARAQNGDEVAVEFAAAVAQPAQETPVVTAPSAAAGEEPQATDQKPQTEQKPVVLTPVHPHRQQRDHYFFGTFGPPGWLSAGLSAGINQWRDVPKEWEQGGR